MNKKPDEFEIEKQTQPETLEPEQTPAPEIPELEPQETEQPEKIEPEKPKKEPKTVETQEEQKPPSKFVLFLRKVLIGLAVVAIIFSAGLLTYHFAWYQPVSKGLDQAKADLDLANQALSVMDQENSRLKRANQTANDEISALEKQLDDAEIDITFYQVLVDANTAQIELFEDNTEGAKTALEDTQASLDDLLPSIEAVNPKLASDLRNRLELIISNLESDTEKSDRDLNEFIDSLLELEPQLIGN